ncbi:MAG: CotH kinase family protein [Candidatus Cloacimonetes bacterium]|nr:CotH kinase family protein [Candidatus Cloacimonadota bacterium]
MKIILLFSILICLCNINLEGQSLTLPIYSIEMAPADFEALQNNPNSDDYYPAVLSFEQDTLNCEVRYRGMSTLSLFPEKRSWKIKFANNNNIFGCKKLNLNAEYADKSLLRNYLTMKLYREIEFISSEVCFRNLFVNGQHLGLFIQIENVDEDFLSRNGRLPNNLYKGKNHGASMAPLTHYDDYAITWDKTIGNDSDYSDIQTLFSKFLYWDSVEFLQNIENCVDIPNIISYFAIEFAISSRDCFTKNIYLFFNEETDKYEVFPWDNDASFGNSFRGVYRHYDVVRSVFVELEHQTLFRRLMDYQLYRDMFNVRVNQVRTSGYTYLHSLIDDTYNAIQNDFYLQPDEVKCCTNTQFDAEMNVLHNCLNTRSVFLNGYTRPIPIQLSEFFCSTSFPTIERPEVFIRLRATMPANILMAYAYNLNWDVEGEPYNFNTIPLFDDGLHGDMEANDLIYGTKFDTSEMDPQLLLYAFASYQTNSQQDAVIEQLRIQLTEECQSLRCEPNGRDDYPANSLFYVTRKRTNTFALNKLAQPSIISDELTIEAVYCWNDSYFVKFTNISDQTMDLSYCYLQAGQSYNKFLLPENTILEAGSSLIVTSDIALASVIFSDVQIIGNLFFDILIGDYVWILSPGLEELLSFECVSYGNLNYSGEEIVINEINYHSADNFNPEDWIELYNNGIDNVNLSNWAFKDENNEHAYIIPDGTILTPNHYLVLAQVPDSLTHCFPNVENVIGGFNFGFSGSGEILRLYNQDMVLIDAVEYSDNEPWPTEPDGGGATLTLIHPDLDNSLPESWEAGFPHGSPGFSNTVSIDDENPVSAVLSLSSYPNPFNPETNIYFTIPEAGHVQLSIYNIKGQRVITIADARYKKGEHSVKWNGLDANQREVASGVYFYRIITEQSTLTRKMLLLK